MRAEGRDENRYTVGVHLSVQGNSYWALGADLELLKTVPFEDRMVLQQGTGPGPGRESGNEEVGVCQTSQAILLSSNLMPYSIAR
jgi:hypothetical protein